MKKLILECGLAPGDIVMLTAAVRDLHYWYPGEFATDVRTRCGDLWENNPHITAVLDDDTEAERIDCSYPLINRCNYTPYHCLHGFIEFLNEKFGLAIRPTRFKGDIHLSKQEKLWYSQVYEVAERNIPFWIIAAGGKYDVTIKWWDAKRYQQVVDCFRGKIQFVQVGQEGHHHPKLDGVIDFRGQTTLRELIRLTYHSQGVLCPVTSLMHLAAAVPSKSKHPAERPCIVIAGGREPAHWEAYPGHQFIHTNGALKCSGNGGCWKDRTQRLRDGDKRDQPGNLCANVVDGLPRCMDLITPEEVIRRIELYFSGGAIQYLTDRDRIAGERGVRATLKNEYDNQPLNFHNAGMACEEFISSIRPYPDKFKGQGIVICGGGLKYFTNAWVCINRLRRSGCLLPIECWYLNESEMDEEMQHLLVTLGVQCVNAREIKKKHPARIAGGWELKPYAILYSHFREVLFLDADNVVVRNPEFLFETPEYKGRGAIFWPDYERAVNRKATPVWRSCGLRQPREPEFETGEIVVDKERCWKPLCLAVWFNENSNFYYRHLYGDKETFHIAFRKLQKSYSLAPYPIHTLEGTMCQHDFQGNRLFQHRNTDKWDLLLLNKKVTDFWFEEECIGYICQLRRLWDARMKRALNGKPTIQIRWDSKGAPRIRGVMLSFVERQTARELSLHSLEKTDWRSPIDVHVENGDTKDNGVRRLKGSYLALKKGLQSNPDYILLLNDGLEFNCHLWHNLCKWAPVATGAATIASIYNPNVMEFACDIRTNTRFVASHTAFGNEAFLISRDGAEQVVRCWRRFERARDFDLRSIASCLKSSVLYHAPSLVQLVAIEKDEKVRRAIDFDSSWKA